MINLASGCGMIYVVTTSIRTASRSTFSGVLPNLRSIGSRYFSASLALWMPLEKR